jgi:uncharacterized Zn-finger protein
MNQQNTQQSSESVILVKSEALPMACPPNDAEVWNMHPKVYLKFDQNGESSCPYCGAKYQLEA